MRQSLLILNLISYPGGVLSIVSFYFFFIIVIESTQQKAKTN